MYWPQEPLSRLSGLGVNRWQWAWPPETSCSCTSSILLVRNRSKAKGRNSKGVASISGLKQHLPHPVKHVIWEAFWKLLISTSRAVKTFSTALTLRTTDIKRGAKVSGKWIEDSRLEIIISGLFLTLVVWVFWSHLPPDRRGLCTFFACL